MEAGEGTVVRIWSVATCRQYIALELRLGTYHGHLESGVSKLSYTSPEILQLFAIVEPQFQGKSSPQLQSEYKIGLPVALSALDIVAYL